MKWERLRLIQLVLLLILLSIGYNSASAQCRLDRSNYQIVLNEQFDTYGGSTSNLLGPTSIWKAVPDNPNSGWGVEYYDPSQVMLIPDGTGGHRLRLLATKLQNTISLPGRSQQIGYKSGMLTLKNQWDLPTTSIPFDPVTSVCDYPSNTRGFANGMFEIRCKTPSGDPNFWDTWPAFWIISTIAELDIIDDISPNPGKEYNSGINDWSKLPWYTKNLDWNQVSYCSSCPEFNITNSYIAGDKITTSWGVTYQANKNVTNISCGKPYTSGLRDFNNDFITFTAVWTPTKITFFVEDRELYTINSPLGKLVNDCPANLIVNLAIFLSANSLPYPQQYSMDIDYIKIYKPIGNDYSLPYKTNSAFVNHDLFENTTPVPTNVSKEANSIATNIDDPNEVFYRGNDNYIYSAYQTNGIWKIKRLEFNDGAPTLAVGDLKYLPGTGAVLYVGQNNKINLFGRSTIEPCGFYHWVLTSNWNCYWCVTDDNIYPGKGSLQVTPNAHVFYRGLDNKMHWYYPNNNIWTHKILPHPNNNTTLVTGNIVFNPSNYQIFYRGSDGRLQSFYQASPSTYSHAWIDENWRSSAYLINSNSGSMAYSPSLNGILYIGTDNKIHSFYWDNGWHHLLIPYSYGSPSLGYKNGDYAKSGITWDDVNNRLLYTGFDGRIQTFYKYNGNWIHDWIDDNWNTADFTSFNSSSTNASSLTTGYEVPDKGIFYTGKDGHLRYFKYETCENALKSCSNSIDKSILKLVNIDPVPQIVERDNFLISPNPCSDFIRINQLSIPSNKLIRLLDITGRILIEKNTAEEIAYVNIEALPTGIYFVNIDCNNKCYNFKIIKE
ncbi:MAG: T9SS type A sorting domain-containing protein [Cytophagaceae bacterium]